MQCVTLSLFRFDSVASRLWAFAMMGGARLFLPRVPGVGFWKICGTGESFIPGLRPDDYAILCTWPDRATAETQLRSARPFGWYHARATESWTLFLSPVTARGAWSGVAPFAPEGEMPDGALAALTRATLRPRILPRFWGRVPDIRNVIGDDPNVVFKIGLGEVPLLHQVTFSIWPNSRSMAEFARADGPHARAIRAVREEHWFREELYARFRILGDQGSWQGRSPLAALTSTPNQEGQTS